MHLENRFQHRGNNSHANKCTINVKNLFIRSWEMICVSIKHNGKCMILEGDATAATKRTVKKKVCMSDTGQCLKIVIHQKGWQRLFSNLQFKH